MALSESIPTNSIVAMMANLGAHRMLQGREFARAVHQVTKEPHVLAGSIRGVNEAAAIMLEADVRGDPRVFGGQYGPIDFNQVIANYWGHPQEQEKYTQRMHRLAEDCARDLPLEQQDECRQNVHKAFKRFVQGDAAMVCLLRNHGPSGEIPTEALQILREHNVGGSNSVVNMFAPGNEADAIRIYRDVQAELFAHVLLTVFHKGNMKRVANDLSSIKQSVLLYQLATDLVHVKNSNEPTFGRLLSHLSLPKHQFALDEARFLIMGPVRQRMLGWAGFLAVGALCRMSGKQAEWEKQPSR